MTATGTYLPIPGEQYEDANGDPAVGYRIFTYLAGTSTKVNTFTDVALSVANANPLTLASDARPTLMGTPGVSYKIVFALPGSDDPPASTLWTRDNVACVPPASTSADTDVSVTAGENIAAGDACWMSDGSGGTTAGRWYRTSSTNTYSSTLAQATGFATAAITSGAAGTVRRIGRVTGLSGLVAGSLYFAAAAAGSLTTTAPANARALLVADSTTAGIILTGPPDATSAVAGLWAVGTQTMPTGVHTIPTAPILSLGATFSSGTSDINEIFARCTSALTKNNSTVLADITGLAFAVGANETWEAKFIIYGVSAAAADWKFTLTGPAAPTALWFGITSTNDPPTVPQAASSFGTAVVGGSVGNDEMILLTILLRNGANAGTVQAQMAQQTADVSNTIVRVDSYVVARRRV